MFSLTFPFALLWITCTAQDYYYYPHNVTRTTISGIAAYRSSLTLDWLAAEDSRQRELAAAFETEAAPPSRVLATECIAYPRPSSGKVARLMLELLKNLEGDEAKLVPELIQVLVRAKLLVETSILEAEPDLEALVKTPGVMMGEPHVTFPRILAVLWMTVTDPSATKKLGWCPINKVNKYIAMSKSVNIAKQMRALEPIVARARFIMEEFIQTVTPLNMYQKKASVDPEGQGTKPKLFTRRVKPMKAVKRPIRYYATERMRSEEREHSLVAAFSTTSPEPLTEDMDIVSRIIDGNQIVVTSDAGRLKFTVLMFFVVLCCL